MQLLPLKLILSSSKFNGALAQGGLISLVYQETCLGCSLILLGLLGNTQLSTSLSMSVWWGKGGGGSQVLCIFVHALGFSYVSCIASCSLRYVRSTLRWGTKTISLNSGRSHCYNVHVSCLIHGGDYSRTAEKGQKGASVERPFQPHPQPLNDNNN
jgi:hypothetical protein